MYAVFGGLMDSSRKTLLLTGPSGLVVVAILHDFVSREEFNISVTTRKLQVVASTTHESVLFSGLGAEQTWAPALEAVGLVVHSAVRVHVMIEQAVVSLVEYRRINVDGMLKLATQAAALDVTRFVLLGLIKANGKGILLGIPYTPSSAEVPVHDNKLVDSVFICMNLPAELDQIFLLSDGDYLSIYELLNLSGYSGKKTIILLVLVGLIGLVVSIIGKGEFADCICGSLQIDFTKKRNLLGWVTTVKLGNALITSANPFQGISTR